MAHTSPAAARYQHANLLCQCTHVWDFQIRLRRRWGCAPKPGCVWRRLIQTVASQVFCRCDVMVEALGDMQHLLPRQSNAFEGYMKIVQGRLVGLGLLRGNYPIKLDL